MSKIDIYEIASFSVNLNAMTAALTGRWFDPRSGSFEDEFAVSPVERRTFRAPDAQDWVLLLK